MIHVSWENGGMGKVQYVAGGGSGLGDGYPCLEVHYKHVI